MTKSRSHISVDVEHENDATILTVGGVLDSSSYRGLRDTVIKCALDSPRAVITDVERLVTPSPSAWSVFTSARWHVSVWPDVPILLTSNNIAQKRTIATTGVTRYVPLHPTRAAALLAIDDLVSSGRRRALAELPHARVSVPLARALIHEWLTSWSKDCLIPVVSTVATIFIENVLTHTNSEPVLIAETFNDTVTVAVEDRSGQPAARREKGNRGADVASGLAIVSAVCRAWGSTPTSSGKTVWAVIGSENRI